jgi:hypothetical protein
MNTLSTKHLMKSHRLLTLWIAATTAWTAGSAPAFRTDINPALRYYQAFLLLPNLTDTNNHTVFETDWRIASPDDRAIALADTFNSPMLFVREAAAGRRSAHLGSPPQGDAPEAALLPVGWEPLPGLIRR